LVFLVDCHSQLQAVIRDARGKTLDPGGEDSLVVKDGVAHEVEVVVLDARPHSEPGLEAARTGLQQGRLWLLFRTGGSRSRRTVAWSACLQLLSRPVPGESPKPQ